MVKHIKCRISEASESKKLKDIPRGKTFEYCGHDWIVLEHNSTNCTLVLAKYIIEEMPFDKNNCNNWAKSSLRKYLNGEFLKEMCVGLLPAQLGFCLFETDLTSDDGLKDYGESRDIVSLLTCDLYRKHRDILEPIDEYEWWTATPVSTTRVKSCCVQSVCKDGVVLLNSAYFVSVGVRPVCCLSSDINV